MSCFYGTNGLLACQNSVLIADGDSITNQNGTAGCTVTPTCTPSSGDNTKRFPDQALTTMGLTSSVTYADVAVGGHTCSNRIAYAPSIVDNHVNALAKMNALTFQCGINDFKQGNQDANSVYSLILNYVTARKAAGWNNVIVLTMEDDSAPSPNGTFQTYRASLNTLIRDGAAGNGYIVMDIAADSTMGCVGCANNTTYFRDGEHPTVSGYTIFANLLVTTLNAIGFN